MKYVRSIIGYFFAGALVFGVWGGVLDLGLGHLGGIVAGMFIIGPMWFMNHALNLVGHAPTSGFVDLGLGVGVAGLANSTVADPSAFVAALPTLAVVIAGGIFGGFVAGMVEKDMAKDK